MPLPPIDHNFYINTVIHPEKARKKTVKIVVTEGKWREEGAAPRLRREGSGFKAGTQLQRWWPRDIVDKEWRAKNT